MAEKNRPDLDPSDRELVFTRLFDAPRALVFEAWTDPRHLAKWWGPQGFSTTTHEFVFKPGGAWKLTMHGPDGVDYPNRLVFDEIVAPERIAYSHHGGSEGVPAQFRNVVTFAEEGTKTRLTMRMVFASKAARDEVVKTYHADEGGRQTLARLAEHVAGMPRKPELFMTRVFDAPRRLVFDAWTKPEHLLRWWGPKGFTLPTCEVALHPGGRFHFMMRGPDGTDYPFEGVYREITPPERLVFTGTVHDGLETETTVTFTEHEGKTTLTLHQIFSAESFATRGAPQGWTESLDRFAEYLARS